MLSGLLGVVGTMNTAYGKSVKKIAPEIDQKTVKVAVKSNADFGIDLYKKIAEDNKGKNIFILLAMFLIV